MALKGIRVLEMAGLAPAPFCGMLLRDFGASVIRIDRPKPQLDADRLCRGKRSIVIDLREKKGVDLLHKMAKKSDVLLEGYRPGVMERMGLGPDVLLQSNPRLVYARLTGFGQTGPYSAMAGHDINYIALSGVLSMLGAYGQKPQPPVNLMADFAGGGLLCALGICMALLERERSGKGQVIDASMTEGCAYVSTFLWRTRSSKMALPIWIDERGGNILDGGAHFYNVYETKDGKHMAVGALEPHFYKTLVEGLGLDPEEVPQFSEWEKCKEVFADAFKRKTQAEWCAVFDLTDGCAVPVLDHESAGEHPHNAHRGTFIECKDGPPVPRPAPLLLRTPAEPDMEEPLIGEHTRQILEEVLGMGDAEVQKLIDDNVVAAPNYQLKSKL
uniref:Alpha-methylacyl-CoA racemase n=1 Tax=Rhipicephalus appendiculatus TaxID=34631 RepID=A0A131Z2I4_RHIAP